MFSDQSDMQNISYERLCSPLEIFVCLLYHSEKGSAGYETSLRDLLTEAHDRDRAPTIILEFEKRGTFILWTTRSSIKSTNSLDDALKTLQCFAEDRKQLQDCFLFHTSKAQAEKTVNDGQYSTLAVLARYDERLLDRLGLLPEQLKEISFTLRQSRESALHPDQGQLKSSLSSKNIYYFMCAVVIIFIILILSINHATRNNDPDKLHTWIQYDTSGSIGPKYQLSVNAENASSWTSYPSYAHDPSSWTLRIDDQALIPSHLFSPAEARYQSLLQKRYPEMNQIRLNGSYLNATWLGSPAIDAVPTDELFHFAHCVLAVKRCVRLVGVPGRKERRGCAEFQ
ncbi:hypothetical protein N0V90_002733 [Kalmusia sp. IMI 367209]|nr:hypothetical protein N0V90_002733 [Kalmusia sp. IMI 367209]